MRLQSRLSFTSFVIVPDWPRMVPNTLDVPNGSELRRFSEVVLFILGHKRVSGYEAVPKKAPPAKKNVGLWGREWVVPTKTTVGSSKLFYFPSSFIVCVVFIHVMSSFRHSGVVKWLSIFPDSICFEVDRLSFLSLCWFSCTLLRFRKTR